MGELLSSAYSGNVSSPSLTYVWFVNLSPFNLSPFKGLKMQFMLREHTHTHTHTQIKGLHYFLKVLLKQMKSIKYWTQQAKKYQFE